MSFNEKREIGGGFDIMNVVIFPNNSFYQVKIGRVVPGAVEGDEVVIDWDRIVWHRGFNEVWIMEGSFPKKVMMVNEVSFAFRSLQHNVLASKIDNRFWAHGLSFLQEGLLARYGLY